MSKKTEATAPLDDLNLDDLMSDVKKLYVKNPRASLVLKHSKIEKKIWTAADGVPIGLNTIYGELTGLPCVPYNKFVQFAGKPDTGKSTTGLEAIAAAQNAGHVVILWDTEEKFDPHRLERFGGKLGGIMPIKTNEIVVGGQLIKDYLKVIKTKRPDAKILIVWDSVGGGVSRANAEINRLQKKHAQPGQEAKEIGQVCRDIVAMMNVYRDSVAVYVANQTYAKIGFMQKGDKAKGGDGIEFFSSLIVFMKRLKVLTQVEDKKMKKTGIITQATVTKNHLTQGDTSIYQQNFEITAAGSKISDFTFKKAEDESEEGDEE